MRLNLIVNSFPTVSETFIFNKVTGLEAMGYKVLICSLNEVHDLDYYEKRLNEWSGNKVYYYQKKWSFLSALLFNSQLRTRNQDLKKKGRPLKSRLGLLRKWHFIHSSKPEIIHFAFSGIAAEFHEVIEMSSSAQIFFSCRGSAEKIRPLIDEERGAKLSAAFKSADRIHCVSEDMRQTILKFGGIMEKTFINHPSINTQRFTFHKRSHCYLKFKEQPFKILSTGRLHFQKGYVHALMAIKIASDKGLNVEYNICGAGPEEGLLKYMIQELSLGDYVKIHGKVSGGTVKSMLAEADMFLLPSIYEGIANAALEAVASGVPLLTTTAGGMNEVIENKQNGIIVDRFSAEQLADGIQFYHDFPDKAVEFAAKALDTLKDDFLHEQQIKVFDEEYRKANGHWQHSV
ncbi:glycosyltransferase family 4 protein [Schleiferiaceae bacterium]|nr:glycosyltransferase family 4 protein [Schleiferiaceae bacterium]